METRDKQNKGSQLLYCAAINVRHEPCGSLEPPLVFLSVANGQPPPTSSRALPASRSAANLTRHHQMLQQPVPAANQSRKDQVNLRLTPAADISRQRPVNDQPAPATDFTRRHRVKQQPAPGAGSHQPAPGAGIPQPGTSGANNRVKEQPVPVAVHHRLAPAAVHHQPAPAAAHHRLTPEGRIPHSSTAAVGHQHAPAAGILQRSVSGANNRAKQQPASAPIVSCLRPDPVSATKQLEFSHCGGRTVDGHRCKNNATFARPEGRYCGNHDPHVRTCVATTKEGRPCKNKAMRPAGAPTHCNNHAAGVLACIGRV